MAFGRRAVTEFPEHLLSFGEVADAEDEFAFGTAHPDFIGTPRFVVLGPRAGHDAVGTILAHVLHADLPGFVPNAVRQGHGPSALLEHLAVQRVDELHIHRKSGRRHDDDTVVVQTVDEQFQGAIRLAATVHLDRRFERDPLRTDVRGKAHRDRIHPIPAEDILGIMASRDDVIPEGPGRRLSGLEIGHLEAPFAPTVFHGFDCFGTIDQGNLIALAIQRQLHDLGQCAHATRQDLHVQHAVQISVGRQLGEQHPAVLVGQAIGVGRDDEPRAPDEVIDHETLAVLEFGGKRTPIAHHHLRAILSEAGVRRPVNPDGQPAVVFELRKEVEEQGVVGTRELASVLILVPLRAGEQRRGVLDVPEDGGHHVRRTGQGSIEAVGRQPGERAFGVDHRHLHIEADIAIDKKRLSRGTGRHGEEEGQKEGAHDSQRSRVKTRKAP